jgi:hypothetical protein
MAVKIIDNYLAPDLAKLIMSKFKDKQGCDRTNRTNWDDDIRENSTVILVNDINDYRHLLSERANQEFGTENVTFSAMFYRWTPLSYIPPHLDYDLTYAISIHLNENYNPKNGGMFLYKESPDSKHWIGVEPIFNRAVLSDTSDGVDMMHQVTPVTSKFDRLSIQMFGN